MWGDSEVVMEMGGFVEPETLKDKAKLDAFCDIVGIENMCGEQ